MFSQLETLTKPEVKPDAKPETKPEGKPAVDGKLIPMTMEQVQYFHALKVLQQTNGNKLRASKLLGISRMTLYRLLGRHEPSSVPQSIGIE